jgi:hypothetical protein
MIRKITETINLMKNTYLNVAEGFGRLLSTMIDTACGALAIWIPIMRIVNLVKSLGHPVEYYEGILSALTTMRAPVQMYIEQPALQTLGALVNRATIFVSYITSLNHHGHNL